MVTGCPRFEGLTRRAARWLVNSGQDQIAREHIRTDALSRTVNATGADDVIARLEAGGFLRSIVTEKPARGPSPRRWAVNPALRSKLR